MSVDRFDADGWPVEIEHYCPFCGSSRCVCLDDDEWEDDDFDGGPDLDPLEKSTLENS